MNFKKTKFAENRISKRRNLLKILNFKKTKVKNIVFQKRRKVQLLKSALKKFKSGEPSSTDFSVSVSSMMS